MRAALLMFLLLPAATCFGKNQQITIEDTGSTNRAGLTLSFDKNGNGTATVRQSEPQPVKLDRKDCRRFFKLVQAMTPLNEMAAVPCAKSVSFGSSLFIEMDQDRSPDVSCPTQDERLQKLQQAAEQMLGEARKNAHLPSGRRF